MKDDASLLARARIVEPLKNDLLCARASRGLLGDSTIYISPKGEYIFKESLALPLGAGRRSPGGRLRSADIAAFRKATKPALCPILGIALDDAQAVLDHDHESGLVRGVIHRQANALLGKIENFHKTFLSKLGIEDIRPVLGAMVDWMEADYSDQPIHPNGVKKLISRFKARNASDQKAFLETVGIEPGNNSKERTAQFRRWINSEIAVKETGKL
jgi:hypothetical protein